jgi:glycerol-3-phosphate dehydrogenase
MNNSENFSSSKRDALIGQMKEKIFDVVIFGGGITGAGIAVDAASRGLKVALFEIDDFASGTSSRSTKLVHGGLRYLEKLQFRFVAELGKERKILHDNVTHNVLPTPVYLPIIKGGQLKKGLSFIGLMMYDFLAGVKKNYRARWIKSGQIIERYPFVNKEGLKGAYLYYEYKTNDGRLVIETLKKAVELGAMAINHCKVKSLKTENNKLAEAELTDLLGKVSFTIKAKHFVNATGPWSEQFMNHFDKPMPKNLYPTKGVHLVFKKSRFPIREAFYFDTRDGRMVFAIPRNEHVYLGTTDTPFNGDVRLPDVDDDDIKYLLKAANFQFKGLQLDKADIVSCWSGVRPLIQEPGKKPGEISRKEELFISKTGLITITGGKLTGFRLMAKQVVDIIIKKLDIPFVACKTKELRASGSDWKNPPSLAELVDFADGKYDEAKQTGINVPMFKELFYRYGTNIDVLTEKAYALKTRHDNPEMLWLETEIWYAVNFEMVGCLADFLIYRTEMVLFKPEWVKENLAKVAEFMALELSWSETQTQQAIDAFMNQWKAYQV